jgi:hypothetical protein
VLFAFLSGYYHESFLRERRDICFEIQRQKVKGTFVRKPAVPENEPNFYRLPDVLSPVSTKTYSVPCFAGLSNAGTPSDAHFETGPSMAFGQSLVSMVSSNADVFANVMMHKMLTENAVQTSSNPTSASADELRYYPDANQAPLRRVSLSRNSFYEPVEFGPTSASENNPSMQQQQFMIDDWNTSFDTLLVALRGIDSTETKSYYNADSLARNNNDTCSRPL